MLFIFGSPGHTYRIVVRDMQIMDLSSRQVIQLAMYHFSWLLQALWISQKILSVILHTEGLINVTAS